jgi:hypothetical protein
MAAVIAALAAVSAGEAAAAERGDAGPQLQAASTGLTAPSSTTPLHGRFLISGAPILSNAPDGWLCHPMISCRPEVLAETGLDDADHFLDDTKVDAPVNVRCVTGGPGIGEWVKIDFTGTVAPFRPLQGWVGVDAVNVYASTPGTCRPGDWIYG